MNLLPDAEPFSHDAPDAAVGILVLHGFTGSPKSMKPWGRELAAQGWSVRVPRLPGHGTRWQDMNLTTWQDWYAEADRALAELTASCSKVFVMGLSMGGSLTLRLAEQHGDRISGIVLVNAAAALIVAGLTEDWSEAMARAVESIDSGSATSVLQRMRRVAAA